MWPVAGPVAEGQARLVQVPFDLPLPESGGLSTIFLDHLRELLERHPAAAVVTEHHWKQIFTPGIEALMRTPRDVVRFINVLRLSYPPLSTEVNTADFIAVEALRIFQPRLYELIRSSPERFAGPRAHRAHGRLRSADVPRGVDPGCRTGAAAAGNHVDVAAVPCSA